MIDVGVLQFYYYDTATDKAHAIMQKPTGFRRGRPCKGEVRPRTAGAEYQKRRRARLSARQRAYEAHINAMYAQFMRLAFPQKFRDAVERSRQRQATWDASPRAFDVQAFMREMARCCKK